jgi:flagellar hook-associated protein 3
MRVSSDMFYSHLTQGLLDNLKDMDKLSNQIATGKKFFKPSDDVLGTLRSIGYKLTLSQNAQAQQTITEATNYLNYNDTILTQLSETLTNLKRVTMPSGGTSEDQAYYASQAAALRDNLLDFSNSTYLNNYIFSGSLSDQPAYTYDDVNHVYVYQGDNNQMALNLGAGTTLKAINIVGNSIDTSLLSPFNYNLVAAKTITLPSGSTVVFTPDRLTSPNSTIINVQITDTMANVDNFSFTNIMDLAHLISNAWNRVDIDGTTALTSQQSSDRIEALANVLDEVQSQVLTVQGQLGVSQSGINDQKTRLTSNTTTQQNSLDNIQEAKMDETIISILKVSTALNALRSASAKILSQSLFDFLR